jgi:hypothetical protein
MAHSFTLRIADYFKLRVTNPFRRVKRYVVVGAWDETPEFLPDQWRKVEAADPQVPKPKRLN